MGLYLVSPDSPPALPHRPHFPLPPLCDRFMEEKLRQKDTMIEKLRLKNSTIKAQIGKMEHMLAHKEEMGEVSSCWLAHVEAMVLRLVDLTCIRIEPAQPSPSPPPPSPLIQVLHLVDFDQLKIENQQYLEKIEERNQDLLRLKLSTSRTVQVRGEGGGRGSAGGRRERGGRGGEQQE